MSSDEPKLRSIVIVVVAFISPDAYCGADIGISRG